MHPKSALGALYQIVERKPPRGSASGSSVVQKYAYSLHYLFLILSVLTLYSQFPTYPQISNLIRSFAIFKYQINSVCLIPIIKSFPPSLYSEQLQKSYSVLRQNRTLQIHSYFPANVFLLILSIMLTIQTYLLLFVKCLYRLYKELCHPITVFFIGSFFDFFPAISLCKRKHHTTLILQLV